jgi:hypothetical protein
MDETIPRMKVTPNKGLKLTRPAVASVALGPCSLAPVFDGHETVETTP